MGDYFTLTLEATMRDLFPTGHTNISQSVSSSDGTSTSHSDSISYGGIGVLLTNLLGTLSQRHKHPLLAKIKNGPEPHGLKKAVLPT